MTRGEAEELAIKALEQPFSQGHENGIAIRRGRQNGNEVLSKIKSGIVGIFSDSYDEFRKRNEDR